MFGAGREEVEAHIAEIAPHAVTVFQEKRGGTGHATQLALAGLSPSGTILVVAGDTPRLSWVKRAPMRPDCPRRTVAAMSAIRPTMRVGVSAPFNN